MHCLLSIETMDCTVEKSKKGLDKDQQSVPEQPLLWWLCRPTGHSLQQTDGAKEQYGSLVGDQAMGV